MLISCSLFEDAILCGDKCHTIRMRKKPPKIGETLFLWWMPRTSQRRLLGISTCTRVDQITLNPDKKSCLINGIPLDTRKIKALALADGFSSSQAFWIYFSKREERPLQGFLIHWEPDYITGKRIRPQVQYQGQFYSDIVKTQTPLFLTKSDDGIEFERQWCDNCNRKNNCFLLHPGETTSKFWIRNDGKSCCTCFCSKANKVQVISPEAIEKTRLELQGQLRIRFDDNG